MKKAILNICLIFFSVISPAQKNSEILLFQVSYRFSGTPDPEIPQRKNQAILYLDVSTNSSYFYSPLRREGDSLLAIDQANGISPMEMLANGPRYKKNQPGFQAMYIFGQQQLTVWDDLGIYFLYEEIMPLQQWQIHTDTLRILELLAYKATTNFRGRDFIAWYCPEIAVPAGPWKFGGLPGLILKIEDTRQHYQYEYIRFEKMEALQLPMPQTFVKDARKTNYSEFAKLRRTRAEDPVGFLNTMAPGVSFTPTNDGSRTAMQGIRNFNPIELTDK
jgi:GLPGLI family protein